MIPSGRAATLAVAVGLGVASPASAAFERSPLSARSAALGGVIAVSPDPVFGNPARGSATAAKDGVVPVDARGTCAAFEVARPFGLSELSEAQAGWARWGSWSVAVGGRRFGSDAYAETEFRLGVARAVGPVATGLAGRFLQVHGHGFTARRGVVLDVGLRADPEPGFALGAVAEAAVGIVPGDPDGEGARTSIGASRRLGPFRLHAEAQRSEATPLSLVLGGAWEPCCGLVLAAGVRESPPTASGGVTVPVPGGGVSATATWVPPIGTTLRLGVNLGPPAP